MSFFSFFFLLFQHESRIQFEIYFNCFNIQYSIRWIFSGNAFSHSAIGSVSSAATTGKKKNWNDIYMSPCYKWYISWHQTHSCLHLHERGKKFHWNECINKNELQVVRTIANTHTRSLKPIVPGCEHLMLFFCCSFFHRCILLLSNIYAQQQWKYFILFDMTFLAVLLFYSPSHKTNTYLTQNWAIELRWWITCR